jgi:predicted GIY-YIG superfamily endonuclease
MPKGFVYILKDDSSRYYIGSTTDVDRRGVQHSSGHTPSTHRMKNPKLVLKQEYPTLEIARKIELKLKKLKRKDYIEKIIADGKIKMPY